MSINTAPVPDSFLDWIRQADDHAAYHLALLERAERALAVPDATAAEDRRRLAVKLERWRYRHLNRRTTHWGRRDEALVDRLDLLAHQLAGRDARPPRATRHAVGDPAFDPPGMAQAVAGLDRAFPLERLVQRAAALTEAHFGTPCAPEHDARLGRRMLLYAPLYASSHCVNYCTYCGFRYPEPIVRKHLTVAEALAQGRLLRQRGLRHVLVVGGEFPSLTTTAYYAQLVRGLIRDGMEPAIEIAPQSTAAYAELVAAGTCGLTLYQETYNERLYRRYHVRGPKASYHWRLESHERAAEAGMRRLGLGILLGLGTVREELVAMMRHASYLQRRFPDRTLAFSLPRIHEAPDDFQVPYPVTDEELVRSYCALRIAFPRAELVLSTREPAALRDRLARTCITQMSAGSSTSPGGYGTDAAPSGEQFPVADHRTPAEVAHQLEAAGFRVRWSVRN